MNPEFRRNLWLELTARRLVLMVAILSLAFFAAALPGGLSYGPSTIAGFLYYVTVVLWGTRSAALSVIGEIRSRTWDAQRLSSLGAAEMAFGKLFGSTSYNWFGGVLCLVVIMAGNVAHHGAAVAIIELVYYVLVGVVAQAASFLASLVAVRRRQAHSRLEVMLYQMAGLAAALAVYLVWSAADPAASLMPQIGAVDRVVWWEWPFGTRSFLLASLAIFAIWIFVACYREMRLELQWRNGPFVWAGFLLFIGAYCAGFDAWLANTSMASAMDVAGLRLALAFAVYLGLTYAMVILEPKDPVQLRWLGRQIVSGRIGTALWNLQAWMMSYAAAVFVAVALVAWIGQHVAAAQGQVLIAAALGFLTRDVAIFVLVQILARRARSDFAAVAILAALYALVPAILGGLHLEQALVFFYPRPSTPVWLAPVAAWGEAFAVCGLAIARLVSIRDRSVMAAA